MWVNPWMIFLIMIYINDTTSKKDPLTREEGSHQRPGLLTSFLVLKIDLTDGS